MGSGSGPESTQPSVIRKVGKAVGVILLITFPAIFMTWRVISTTSVECEVCMEFRGRTECRRALGPDRKSCQRTGTDNACGLLASGMTDSIACSSRPPERVTFLESEE